MAFIFSNHVKAQLWKKQIDIENDDIKLILMQTGFSFNKDTHSNYSDVSGSELAAGFGYTTGGVSLTNVTVIEDDVNDRGTVVADNAVFNASGGTIGPSPGALIYKNTGTPATSTVIGYGTFSGGNQSAGDGTPFTVSGIELRLS